MTEQTLSEKINEMLNDASSRDNVNPKKLNSLNEMKKIITSVNQIENILGDNRLVYSLFGQIGTGKSSFLSSLLPNIVLSNRELIEPKTKIPIDNSKKLERSSILPVGKGRTTLTKIVVSYSNNNENYQVFLVCHNRKDTLRYVNEYIDFLWSKEKENEIFPLELARFLRNISVKNYLIQNKLPSTDIDVKEYIQKVVNANSKFEKDKLKNLIISSLKMSDTESKYLFSYSDEYFKKLFPALYKRIGNEPEENKKRRFTKRILQNINNGYIQGIGIPAEIRIKIPNNNSEREILFHDTKGSEGSTGNSATAGSFINSDIMKFSKDRYANILFISRTNDAPTNDIREVVNEKSIYESIKDKSIVVLMVKDEMDEKEIRSKYWDCEDRLPKMKDKFYMYNSYQAMSADEDVKKIMFDTQKSIWQVLEELDISRRASLEEERKMLLEELKLKFDWFENGIEESEEIVLKEILNKIDSEKKTLVIEKLSQQNQIKEMLLEAIIIK